MDSIRVSPRHLGQMRRSDFCPRCFWYSIALGFRHPFDMPMAGLMYNLDKFEKLIVDAHFEAKSTLPKWLGPLGCTETVAFPAKMTEELPDLGLTLVGMPDAVLRKKDESLYLIDFKTARCKGDDDPFLPGYEAQLWGYARLLRHNRIGKVTSAALVYFENRLVDYSDAPLDLLTGKGISVPFEVKIHEVEIDLKELDELLKKFRAFADLPKPPKRNGKCKTCDRLERLFEIDRKAQGQDRLIRDMERCNSTDLNYLLRKGEANRRHLLAVESKNWEIGLMDEFTDEFDSVPAVFDL